MKSLSRNRNTLDSSQSLIRAKRKPLLAWLLNVVATESLQR